MSRFMDRVFKVETQLLLGRLLTRSGDQAWDFVVPFALLSVFPGKLQIAALYYLIMKIGTFLVTPWIGKWMDSQQRSHIVRVGIWIQFAAVLGGMGCFYVLNDAVHGPGVIAGPTAVIPLFGFLVFFGVLASLGSLITDISVGNDLAPALISPDKLTHFNSWLRRIDLGSEVGAPIVAGGLFAVHSTQVPMAGLFLVAVWNLVSFVPEYFLLQNVIQKSGLHFRNINATKSWKELFHFNVKESVSNPIFLLILSYSLLWLSVLSPHGVLLTGYLKDRMSLPEVEIGIFRGLGAVFGLISTWTFPYLVGKYGLIPSSRWHLGFQGLTLTAGIVAFAAGSSVSVYVFLGCILLSRVGLYGFSNGEFELRQRLIPEGQRGELNSLSSLTTTLATLILFGTGSFLPNTDDFKYLVYGSGVAVLAANIVFLRWAAARNSEAMPGVV